MSVHSAALAILALLLPAASPAQAQPDSLANYWLEPIVVEATSLHQGEFEILLDKTNHTEILRQHGFAIIERGPSFASDLYLDGLKREDIVLRVDGERFPCACPNRMDSPVSRINPLEVRSCDVDKCSCASGSGLGGSVEFQRDSPGEAFGYQAAVSGSALSAESVDMALAADWRGYRFTARSAAGGPAEDGDGRDFLALYGPTLGFDDEHGYSLTEFSLFGGDEGWRQGASFHASEDVVFPYLLMDERETEFWSLHSSWHGHKVYANHTRHLMDNALRNQPMLMVSDADNLTFGVAGSNYEVYYRNWDFENFFHSPMLHIDNHMMPDLRLFSATADRRWYPATGVTLGARMGVQRQWLGDSERLSFHQELYPEAEDQRWFMPFGLMASAARPLARGLVLGFQADLGSEPPHPRDLYISVQKPGGKPWWSGNPELDAPVRATLRSRLVTPLGKVEVYGTQIWDYSQPVATALAMESGPRPYQTFENVEARLFGVNLALERRLLAVRASYLLGKNVSGDRPLSEIQPVTVATTLRAPRWRGWGAWLRHTWTDAQTRVDTSLNEPPTPGWQRLDLGLSWTGAALGLNLELTNIANEAFSEHLSYQRDPFAAKERVWAPGRLLRLALSYRG